MDWQESFLIMKRWYYRLDRPKNMQLAYVQNDMYKDDFFRAFFIHCYHLKDALINSGYNDVESFINQHHCLQLAGDIANFSKHTKLKIDKKHGPRTRTGDISTKGYAQTVQFVSSNLDGPNYITNLFITESGGKQFDAFSLATDCMDAWAEYLLSKSLEIPEYIDEKIFANFPRWRPKASTESLKTRKIKPRIS